MEGQESLKFLPLVAWFKEKLYHTRPYTENIIQVSLNQLYRNKKGKLKRGLATKEYK